MKKVFDWLVKVHSNDRVNVLKTLSRLFGFTIFGICYFCGLDAYISLYVLAANILIVDITFLSSGFKESQYKNKDFYKMDKTTSHALDRYQFWMTILKTSIFLPAILFDAIFFYAFFCFLIVPFVAYFCDFKSFIPHASDMSKEPFWKGKPGYDMSGNLTGSVTAVGGGSN